MLRVPKELVFLGWVLDAMLEKNSTIVKVKDEWYGWFLATVPGAEHMAEGKARVFMFPSINYFNRDKAVSDKAADTFNEWTAREPDEVVETDTPDDFPYVQGRLLRLGYSSDKWEGKGRFFDYEHDFHENQGVPPLVRTDSKNIEASKGVVITGGSMRITAEGIA